MHGAIKCLCSRGASFHDIVYGTLQYNGSWIRFLLTSKSLSDTPPHIPPASSMEFMASRDASNGVKFITFRAKKYSSGFYDKPIFNTSMLFTNQIYSFISGVFTIISINLKQDALA